MPSAALRFPGAKSLWSHNPIPTGCVHYAPLWSPGLGGQAFKTADPFGHACTVTGTTQDSRGRKFDGDDYIEVAANSALEVSSFTVAAWTIFRDTDAQGIRHICGQYFIGATEDGYQLYARWTSGANIKLAMRVGDAGGAPVNYEVSTQIVTNTWYFLAGTLVSGGNQELFLDAVSKGMLATTMGKTPVLFEIGRTRFAFLYNGDVGDTWLFNRVLTLAEIAYIYNQTKGRYL